MKRGSLFPGSLFCGKFSSYPRPTIRRALPWLPFWEPNPPFFHRLKQVISDRMGEGESLAPGNLCAHAPLLLRRVFDPGDRQQLGAASVYRVPGAVSFFVWRPEHLDFAQFRHAASHGFFCRDVCGAHRRAPLHACRPSVCGGRIVWDGRFAAGFGPVFGIVPGGRRERDGQRLDRSAFKPHPRCAAAKAERPRGFDGAAAFVLLLGAGCRGARHHAFFADCRGRELVVAAASLGVCAVLQFLCILFGAAAGGGPGWAAHAGFYAAAHKAFLPVPVLHGVCRGGGHDHGAVGVAVCAALLRD